MNDIPSTVRPLGMPLLAFILGLSEADTKELLANSGNLDSQRKGAIRELESIMLEVRRSRLSNNTLETSDILNIPYLRSANGKHPFNNMRDTIVGTTQIRKSGDQIKDAMSEICRELFPLFLIPTAHGTFSTPSFTSILSSSEIVSRILISAELRQIGRAHV